MLSQKPGENKTYIKGKGIITAYRSSYVVDCEFTLGLSNVEIITDVNRSSFSRQ